MAEIKKCKTQVEDLASLGLEAHHQSCKHDTSMRVTAELWRVVAKFLRADDRKFVLGVVCKKSSKVRGRLL